MKKAALTFIAITCIISQNTSAQSNKTGTPEKPESEKKETWGLGAHPIIGYDTKSSLTIGAGAVIYFEPASPDQDLDEIEIHSTYNFKNQYDVMAVYSKYFKNNICCIDGGFGYQNYPDDYLDMDYDAVFFPFELGASFKIHENIYIGPMYKFQYSDTDFADNDSANQKITGAGKAYSSGVGGQVVFKNLPKGQHYRREGNILTASYVYHSPLIGSSYKFTTLKADFSQYFPVFDQCVLAFQLAGKACLGDVPFFDMQSLEGKNILRGGSDMSGKYLLAGQTEFRFPVYWRLGATFFIGAGEVETRIKDFKSDISVAGGAGLRVALNSAKNINMRFDFAVNERLEKNFYIKIKEAF